MGPKHRSPHGKRSSELSIERGNPIGVFDSGAGGLTVVRTLLGRLPGERIVYFGDTAYVPYGPRPPEEIRRFAVDACRFLCGHGVKLIVMGCNMSSAMALDEARAAADCPVLGTIDAGARAAVATTRSGRIGVAATEGTVKSHAYERAVKALRPDAEVFQQPCPPLVPAVEAGLQDGLLADAVAQSLEPLRDQAPDTVILGCTHYPLVRDEIQAYLGDDVQLVDPAEVLAEQAEEELRTRGTASGLEARPTSHMVECHASGPADSLRAWALKVLGIDLGSVEEIDIHRG
jgi:glutamate racemase